MSITYGPELLQGGSGFFCRSQAGQRRCKQDDLPRIQDFGVGLKYDGCGIPVISGQPGISQVPLDVPQDELSSRLRELNFKRLGSRFPERFELAPGAPQEIQRPIEISRINVQSGFQLQTWQ